MKIMLALWLMLLATLAQALTPAGTVIMAQAEVVFFDTGSGQPVTLLSNQSALTVAPVAALALVQDQDQMATPGQQVFFIHRLAHRGNIPDRFKVAVVMADGRPLEKLGVYEYQGSLPSPDTPTLKETRILKPDEVIELVVMGTVPSESTTDDKHVLTLSAQSQSDSNIRSENRDTVTIGESVIRLQKTVDKREAKAGELLTYTISLQNNGSIAIPGRDLVVDGQPRHGVVLEDPLPTHTQLNPDIKPVFAPVQAVAMVRTESRDWLSFDNWDKTTPVTRIGLLIPSELVMPGDRRRLSFTARIDQHINADTLINNRAFISLDGTDVGKAHSNPVLTRVVSDEPPVDDVVIRFVEPNNFHKQPDFTDGFHHAGYYYLKEDNSHPQYDVYLELEGGNFSFSKETADTVIVDVHSGKNDNIRVLLQETGQDTGLFRSQSPLRLFKNKQGGGLLCQSDSQQPDYSQLGSQCILQTEVNDILTASVVDPLTNTRYQSVADVSPQGRVFDSSNLSMVNGVYINLTDLEGAPAIDLETGKPWQGVETGKDGHFDYPRLEPGRYFITVSAPETFTAEPPYKFPSKVAPEKMPGMVINDASYGRGGMNGDEKKPITGIEGSFVVDEHRRLAHFDVPIDPVAEASGLTLEKEAKQKEVAPGELVTYELKVKNNLDIKLYNLQINDKLPLGFKYMKGSTRINGKQVDDPEGGAGPELTFRVRTNPALDANGEVTITYALKAGAGGIDGDGINRATATARKDVTGQSVTSNEAKAQVNTIISGLTLKKEAKQKEVAPGELVTYKLKVKNNLDIKLYNLQIIDKLPLGFKYMKGSTRINEKQADDPEGGAGPELTFRVKTNPVLDAKGEVTITYALKAGAGGIDGDGINRATATARQDVTGPTFSSNEAKAQVNTIISGLTLEKEAKQKEVAPGELVVYELKVKNNLDIKLYNLQIIDKLPLGFKYMKGSTRINEKQAGDPEGGAGPELTFRVRTNPALDANGEVKISYALKAGAGGIDGDGINRATATARRDVTGQAVSSNEAKAQVNVAMTGVLSDKGIIFGKLYVDKDCNSLQTQGEWPIGGVRLYMEDGTWVITDENGQYSLMGIRPGQHVLKVDPVTMPDGLTLKPIDNRNAAVGDSRFVDIAPGEMHRADFAAQCPTGDYQKVFDQIKARNESISGEWLLDDAAKYNRSQRSDKADNTGDLSHGVVRAPTDNNDKKTSSSFPRRRESTTAVDSRLRGNDGVSRNDGVSKNDEPKAATIPVPDEAVKHITREQAMEGHWLWPENDRADGRFMAVVRAGVEPTLYVNGEAVAHDRLGEQMVNSREQAQLMAWYGVALNDGENQVEVKATDMFGNERVLASGRFTQSAAAETIAILPESDTLAADDGRSLLPVTIKLLDKNGLPARGVYFVTLEASAGRWHEPDIQDQEPGHQVRIDQGELTVHLRSGNASGPVTLRASTGEMKTDVKITQVAAPRPMVAAGLVEFNAGHGRISGAVSELDTIRKGTHTDGRAAVFAKGEIAKDVQLTLSYDSDKDEDTELFRDVNPDDYYPITGDASQKGYEAQSRSKLYAKVEKDRSSIMWGDYQTDAHGSEHNLAKIQRNLNGVNAIYDNGDTRIHGFAARPENSHFTETLYPDGTAMNYKLEKTPIERHSETVVLEAFHPDNPGLVINSETMTRGRDYTLDEFSGYLKFSKPIHSRDDKGNVQRIRVSYDLRDGGEAYTVAGVRAEQTINEQVKVGGSYTRNEHTTEGSDLSGAWVEYKPSEKTTIAVSAAHMTGKSPVKGGNDKSVVENFSGDAARVKLKHKWNNASETELTWARADEGYKNSASGISSGREETRLKHRQQLTDNTSLRAEAEVSQTLNDSGSSQGDSLGAYLDHKVGDGWKLSAGSRYIRQRNEKDNDRYATGQVGAEKSFKLLEKDASVKAEYEQALTNSRKRFALETNWKVHEKVSAYGRVERDENLSPVASGSDRNLFSVGVKSEWLPKTKTYSEYRMRGATDGKAMEWVNGADTSVTLTKGLTITPSLEVINTVSGKGNNDGVAVSMGIQDKRHANQRATGRIEYRNGKSQNYYGLDAAVARRINLDWSGLVRTQFRLEQPKTKDSSRLEKHALTLGLARRPKQDNVQHGLYLYEWKKERGKNAGDNRTVHLVSTHQNRKIDKDLTLSGRIGSKWVCTTLEDYQYNSQSWVSDARLTWSLNRRWDLDLRAGVLGVDGTDSLRWSAGAGIYYLVVRNLRVGAYYNVVGFSDKDLDSEKYNAEGIHFSMLFKFDESLFGWFNS
ncbi:hypothetical protein NX722_12950 [Endozoicomonas gorgoniicola]|uniref:DUF11 domain-containing protein n=1 Tax=Endozoicomonas gorgoniicola TaxID=1234144 RepID=A0ABT3MVX5_9GAMM|nr:hypothetical protein [Endozoicomonas gorgoniicola]MCW7553515.1 hypothetical protein [Endozoicomonas gorgoniicola]